MVMLPPMRSLIASLLVAPLMFACDDSGGESGITNDTRSDATLEIADAETVQEVAPETEATAPETADTAAPEDTPEDTIPQDTTPADTEPADTAPEAVDTAPETVPDTAPEAVDVAPEAETNACADNCLPVGAGPTGVDITNDATTTAPTLAGVEGDPLAGDFELVAIDVYTKGAFDGFLITGATVEDVGETSGTVSFVDDRWAFFLDLDLNFEANTVLGAQSGASRNMIGGGGCYTVADNDIVSDTSACATGWPEGTTPPDGAEFGYDSVSGTFELKIVLDKEFVVALVPEEYRAIAGNAIKGPITFIATLKAAE